MPAFPFIVYILTVHQNHQGSFRKFGCLTLSPRTVSTVPEQGPGIHTLHSVFQPRLRITGSDKGNAEIMLSEYSSPQEGCDKGLYLLGEGSLLQVFTFKIEHPEFLAFSNCLSLPLTRSLPTYSTVTFLLSFLFVSLLILFHIFRHYQLLLQNNFPANADFCF